MHVSAPVLTFQALKARSIRDQFSEPYPLRIGLVFDEAHGDDTHTLLQTRRHHLGIEIFLDCRVRSRAVGIENQQDFCSVLSAG